MQISQWLLTEFEAHQFKHIFLIPGGEIDPLVAALGETKRIIPIVACHETGAGFMADGYARVRNNLAACFAIGAPGAANFIPAAITAKSDRSKVFFITGGSPTTWAGRGAFQDSSVDGTDDRDLFRLASKYSETVTIANQFSRKFYAALRTISAIPQGPVHLTIPKDILQSEITHLNAKENLAWRNSSVIDVNQFNKFKAEFLIKKTKIALLIGRGALLSNASSEILKFVETYHIPFATTFSVKGILPEDHPLSLGMFGYAGHRRTIETLMSDELELLIVLGSSLNARDTLVWSKEICQNGEIIQVDNDSKMIGRNYPVSFGIHADCNSAMKLLNQTALDELTATNSKRTEWLKSITNIPLFYPVKKNSNNIFPPKLIEIMNATLPNETLLFIDSGAHRAFAGHYWISKVGGMIYSATNLGPMGWAIPAAIGGKLAAPNKTVVVITGDGCMRMHGIEIATAARYQIPVIFVISNNSALGNVYLREKKINAGAAAITLLPTIDWVEFAKGLGVDGIRVTREEEIAPAIKQAIAANKPFVIDAITDPNCLTPIGPYQKMVTEYFHENM